MRSKEKVTVKWSKKEKDWQSRYPEWENRNARIVGNQFFNMIREYEEFMSKNWEGKPTGFTTLRDYLSQAGFDPDTFTISVNAKVKAEK
ncbi:hypothetical protein [Pedobacter sp.]|uniref:hypothetical protein n=1 Tax=Pedobacter sp. TaxID=1411316 RepID=UPI003C43F06D